MKKQSLQEIDNILSLMERIENTCKTSKIVEQKERLMALSSLKPLDESGINRILSHGENGFIVISAIRNSIDRGEWEESICDLRPKFEKDKARNPEITEQEWLKQRNNEMEKSLFNAITNANLSFTKTYGGYREGSGDVKEKSYIVFAKDRQGNNVPPTDLFELGKLWCKEFNQDSFFYKCGEEAPNYFNYNGEKKNKHSSNKVEVNRNSKYFTTTKRKKNNDKRFSYDIVFENKYVKATSTYENKPTMSPATKMMLEQKGYIFV